MSSEPLSHILLSIASVLAILCTSEAFLLSNSSSSLSQSRIQCSNLLDANELHGDWVDGATNIKACKCCFH